MASGTIPLDALDYFRKGDTISLAGGAGYVGNYSNGTLTVDLFTPKSIPGSVGVSASGVTVSAIRGNSQTESAVTATYSSCSKGSNFVRLQFSLTGVSGNQVLFIIYLSAGTITFT